MRSDMAERRRNAWKAEFVKFSLVGVLNTAIDFVVFMLLIWLSVHYAAAQVISYLAGMTNSYVLNSAFTFRSKLETVRPARSKGSIMKQRLRFIIWNVVMLVLSILMLAILTQAAGISEITAKAIVTVIIVAINFYGSKRWVFVSEQVLETE